MRQYLDLMTMALNQGHYRKDRTGTGALSVFGHQMRFDLAAGYPLLTTKSVHFKSVIVELLWFLSGSTNVKFLQDHGVTIWNEWADENGDLGPVYGHQWRKWGRDQIQTVIDSIKTAPYSRRHIVSAWNVEDIPNMALAPCHTLFQFFVQDGRLSCQIYQRSADIFLGVPFNIASYAALTMMIAQQCDLLPGELVWTGGDCHLYVNHINQARKQLARSPLPLPRLEIKKAESIDYYKLIDFTLSKYNPHPSIKAPIAV